MQEIKIRCLAEMFATFPSFQPSATRLRDIVQLFLADLEPYSAGTVSRACRVIRQQTRQFPPNGGEIIGLCERLAPKGGKGLPPVRALKPLDKLSDEEREESRRRVQKMVDDLWACRE